MSDEWLDGVAHMWSAADVVEFTKVGIEIEHIVSAYNYLASLPKLPLMMDANVPDQWTYCKSVLAACTNCAKRTTTWTADPERTLYISYDETDRSQACVARIAIMLFRERHWTSFFGEEMTANSDAKSPIGLLLIAPTMLRNPYMLGFATALGRRNMPVVTAIGAGQFQRPDQHVIDGVKSGRGLSAKDRAIIQQYAPGATGVEVAESVMKLYKILAWQFHPGDSEPVMKTEFVRILERVDIEHSRQEAGSRVGTVFNKAEHAPDFWDEDDLEDGEASV